MIPFRRMHSCDLVLEQAHAVGKGCRVAAVQPNVASCCATHLVASTYRRGAHVVQPLQKSPH